VAFLKIRKIGGSLNRGKEQKVCSLTQIKNEIGTPALLFSINTPLFDNNQRWHCCHLWGTIKNGFYSWCFYLFSCSSLPVICLLPILKI